MIRTVMASIKSDVSSPGSMLKIIHFISTLSLLQLHEILEDPRITLYGRRPSQKRRWIPVRIWETSGVRFTRIGMTSERSNSSEKPRKRDWTSGCSINWEDPRQPFAEAKTTLDSSLNLRNIGSEIHEDWHDIREEQFLREAREKGLDFGMLNQLDWYWFMSHYGV